MHPHPSNQDSWTGPKTHADISIGKLPLKSRWKVDGISGRKQLLLCQNIVQPVSAGYALLLEQCLLKHTHTHTHTQSQ